jgi:hypothetical protein
MGDSVLTGADVNRPRIIAIVGTSFSGSTIANLIFGAHPDIHAGGELSALVLQRNQEGGSCSSCGFGCVHWNEEARASVSEDNLYSLITGLFKKQIITDSSKSVQWFGDVLSRRENAAFSPVYVLMIKHPIRYLASCLVNIDSFSRSSIRGGPIERILALQRKARLLERWTSDLEQFYDNLFRNIPRDIGNDAFHALHYERLVGNPSNALSPILASLGLSFHPAMDAYYDCDFHQIGGNAGAVFQVDRRWSPGNEGMPAFRREFYERTRGLKIDNKFESVFSPREIAKLKSNSAIKRLVEKLGYNKSTMPFPI